MPDSTVTGPVGWTTSRGCFGRCSAARSRAWRLSCLGRAAPVSITTRRLRRPGGAPWRGRIGRFGLFGRSAIRVSVDPCQPGIDPDGRFQGAIEGSPVGGALEAREPPARVDAAAGAALRVLEGSVPGDKPQQLGLRRLPAATRTRPGWSAHAAGGSSSCFSPSDWSLRGSTGIPAGRSSGGAVAGWEMSRSTSPSASAIASALGPWTAATSAGASLWSSSSSLTGSTLSGPMLSASGGASSAAASSSGSGSSTIGSSSAATSGRSASS